MITDPGYIMRTPNQFVDQGYSNYGSAHQQQQQKIFSTNANEQLNAPRMVQHQQQHQQQYKQQTSGPRTHIIPITIEGSKTNAQDGRNESMPKSTVVIPK